MKLHCTVHSTVQLPVLCIARCTLNSTLHYTLRSTESYKLYSTIHYSTTYRTLNSTTHYTLNSTTHYIVLLTDHLTLNSTTHCTLHLWQFRVENVAQYVIQICIVMVSVSWVEPWTRREKLINLHWRVIRILPKRSQVILVNYQLTATKSAIGSKCNLFKRHCKHLQRSQSQSDELIFAQWLGKKFWINPNRR